MSVKTDNYGALRSRVLNSENTVDAQKYSLSTQNLTDNKGSQNSEIMSPQNSDNELSQSRQTAMIKETSNSQNDINLTVTNQSTESTANTLRNGSSHTPGTKSCRNSENTEITVSSNCRPSQATEQIKETSNVNQTLHQPLTISSVSNACWYFHAEIEDFKIPLLFNTGSPVSIISKDVYESLANKPSLSQIETNLLAANGTKLNILGQGTFRLVTEVKDYDWKFLVADIEGNMGLIGQDFIESQGKSLKWKNLTWKTKAGVIKLFKLHSDKVAKILVAKSVNIPPESEMFLTARTDYPLYQDMNMIEPVVGNQKRGLFIARSLFKTDGKSQISVMNITDKSIKLKSGDVLGQVCPVTESHSHSDNSESSVVTDLPEHLQPLLDNLSPDLTSDERQQFCCLLSEFQDIFVGPDGQLGQTHLASHKIDVQNSKPIKIPPRKCKVKFQWDDKCEVAFNALKQRLVSLPILAYPTRTGKLILQTDALGFAIGAILSQEQDGKEVVLAYASKTLTKSQQNYCTTMRELYAVVYFLRHFKHYLMGRHFDILTDHASLVWIKNFKDADGMLSRWLTVIDTYDFSIFHRKGSQMRHVDALSRIPPRKCRKVNCADCFGTSSDWTPSPSLTGQELSPNPQTLQVQSEGGENATVISAIETEREGLSSPSLNASDTRNRSFTPNWLETKSKEELRSLQLKDHEIAVVLQCKESNEKPSKEDMNNFSQNTKTYFHHWDLLEIREGVLFKKYIKHDQIFYALVTPEILRKDIFKELHANRTSGHFGRDKTVEMIKRRFYWPNITDSVNRWCMTCDMCAQYKPGPGGGRAPLKQIKVSRRFQVIALDIFGPLPITDNSNEYIVVIADYFTKYTEAFALPNHTALTVADKLVTEIFCRYGCAEQIHSDQGREFESILFTEVCRLLGIKKTRTCPYRPNSDAVVERFNRTLKQMLTIFPAENPKDWDDFLPYLMMAYRSSEQASTKCTPNLMMYGQEINCPIDLMYGPPPDRTNIACPVEYLEWLQSAMTTAYRTAAENLNVAAKRQKAYYDRLASEPNEADYQVGKFVWRFYHPAAGRKLELDWTGPYLIVDKLSDLCYSIQKNPQRPILNVHIDHIKPYLGENSPEPWVTVNVETDTEASQNKMLPIPELQEESLPISESREEGEESNYVPLPSDTTVVKSPVRTRVGRAVKPRQIYSP